MINLKTYDCGVRLINDYSSDRKVANISFFVASGSGFDLKNKEGIAHFYEHMFFKSTKSRSAKKLLQELDSLGGLNNAYTSYDRTCYYGKVILSDVEKLFQILSDCFFNGLFLEDELNTEKGVVCSEIDKYEDDFMDCCVNNLNEELFKGTNFAHPILGSKQSVMSIKKEDFEEYRTKNNSSGRLIVSISGGVDFQKAQNLVEKYILPNYKTKEEPIVYKNTNLYIPKIEKNLVTLKKDTNQVYFLGVTPTIRSEDDNFLKLKLASIIFGGTMSSRLFTRMREKEGIVYQVQSFLDNLCLCGNFGVSFITEKSTAKKALKAYKDEVQKVLNDGFSEEELKNTKHLFKTNLLIADENIDSKSRKNAASLLEKGESFDVFKTIEEIENIKLADLNDSFSTMLKQDFMYSIVSKNDDLDVLNLLK